MATIASPAAARMRSDRVFYTGVGLAVAATVFWGFAPSFYLAPWLNAPPTTPQIGALLALHGILFSAWVVLMVVQPMLIARRAIPIHRRLGLIGIAVAILMVAVGNVAAADAMNSGFRGLGDPLVFYAVPFFAINAFAVTAFFAFRWRHHAETHKRLILLSNCSLLGAAIARIPLAPIQGGAPFTFIFGPDLIILASILYDLWSRGRAHRIWLVGGALVFASQVATLAVMGTGWWHGFAQSVAALAR